MKRYTVAGNIVWPEKDGAWLSYNQVLEFLQIMVYDFLSEEEIESMIASFDAKKTVWWV